MDDKSRRNKSNPKSAIVSILVVLLFLLPTEVAATLVVIGIFAVPVVLLVRSFLRKSGSNTRKESPAFDECPQPFFCFHRDKGEHHVRKGREIDPWDRPDIDISKYQRR